MKIFKKFVGVILFSALTISVFAEIETIYLQNGLNNYTGCKDTYLVGPDSSTGLIDTVPKGDEEELVLHGYH